MRKFHENKALNLFSQGLTHDFMNFTKNLLYDKNVLFLIRDFLCTGFIVTLPAFTPKFVCKFENRFFVLGIERTFGPTYLVKIFDRNFQYISQIPIPAENITGMTIFNNMIFLIKMYGGFTVIDPREETVTTMRSIRYDLSAFSEEKIFIAVDNKIYTYDKNCKNLENFLQFDRNPDSIEIADNFLYVSWVYDDGHTITYAYDISTRSNAFSFLWDNYKRNFWKFSGKSVLKFETFSESYKYWSDKFREHSLHDNFILFAGEYKGEKTIALCYIFPV